MRDGQLCQTPEMPIPYAPIYKDWEDVMKVFPLNLNSTLVGHSAGAGFFLKYLSHNPQLRIKKLVLVAPWLDPEKECGNFLEAALRSQVEN